MSRENAINNILHYIGGLRHKIFFPMKEAISHLDISLTEMYIMRSIIKHQGISVKELAEKMKVTSSAMTQVIDKLMNKGYVLRTKSEEDARYLILSISDKGMEMIKIIKREHFPLYKKIFDSLTDEELISLETILDKISK